MLRQFAHASLFALAFVGVTFGSSGLALAGGPPSVSVNGKADLGALLTTITVVVDVSCGDGSTEGLVEVAASQSSAIGDASGSGFMAFTSNGSRQPVAVSVDGGPWNVGPAIASAALYCGTNLADFDLGAKISIQ